ncbi:MAG: Yip1 family protein [bacterium]
MNRIIDTFLNPRAVFVGIKEKPEWLLPLVTVLVVLTIISILTISITRDLITAQQIEALKNRNMTDEQIEQALKFSSGPIMFIFGGLGAIINTLVILLIFAALLNLFIPMFGGEGSFKMVFSVVSFSALIKIPGNIIRFILVILKHSLQVSTSLALFVPNLDTHSFAYRLLNQFDFFILWEMCLVAYGIHLTNNVKKENSYILVFVILIASVLLSIALGSLFGRS